MLRRVQPIALKADSETSGGGSRDEPAPSASDRRQGDRRQEDRRQGERRQGDRRGMEALRAEALQQLITRVEDKNFGGLRNQVHWNAGFKQSRIILIAIAVIAGGMAAFLAVQRPTSAPAPAPEVVAPIVEVVAEPRTQILVARESIRVGERLRETSFEWIDWPDSALRSDFITITALPEAATQMSGSTARFAFFPGEPIRAEKLMPASDGSFLASVLSEGMRGVSVNVTADTASGGFVVPGDRVDVVLTRPTEFGGQLSQTVLHNVRVLAINSQLGSAEPRPADEAANDNAAEPKVFSNAIATLELDATAAEVIMTATAYGRLSLILRAMSDTGSTAPDFQSPANQAIRLSSPFWTK